MNAPLSLPAPLDLFSNLSREHGFEPAQIDGTLPEGLRGTLYRNGVGIFEQFGRRYDHVFEGDGAISAIRFTDRRAFAAARVIQSAGLVEERTAGRHLGTSPHHGRPGFDECTAEDSRTPPTPMSYRGRDGSMP